MADRISGKLFTLVHPMAYIAPSALIEKVCIIEVGVVISSYTMIDTSSIVMCNTVAVYDAKIGKFCQ